MPATYKENEQRRKENQYKLVIIELATTPQENITGSQSCGGSPRKDLYKWCVWDHSFFRVKEEGEKFIHSPLPDP